MKLSQSRGQKLALKNTKIVSSQPPSHGEGPEASPTRKSGRWRANALSQSPGETMPPKNHNVVDKQIERRTTPTTTMQTDEDAELGDRLKTPNSTSSSSGTVPLVRSGSSTTTKIQAMKNGISNTPQPDIATSTSRKIIRERSSSGPTASHSKNKHVFAQDANGLSDDIEDDSSEDITDNKKRKRHSRAALDDCFDHSDEHNSNETSPQVNRGGRNDSLEIHTDDNSRKRKTQSAGKNHYPTRKIATLDYEDEDTYTTKSSSRSRASTPQEEKIPGKYMVNKMLPCRTMRQP
jgi:hypothetical protein